MKDIHNHILYGIDDGPSTKEESIKLLSEYSKRGITSIVCTPHYIDGTKYSSDNKTKLSILKSLQSETDIKLYIGNEVYIDLNILENIKSNKISTINNSKYLLIELPVNNKLNNTSDILLDLINNNIIPIIAHIERYKYLTIKDIEDIKDIGCLLQGNTKSLNAKDFKVKRRLKQLLKNHMIDVLGTDYHKKANDIDKSLITIKKLVKNDDYYENITNINYNKIVGE